MLSRLAKYKIHTSTVVAARPSRNRPATGLPVLTSTTCAVGARRFDVQRLQQALGARGQPATRQQKARRFGQPQQHDRNERQRQQAAYQEDHRPAVMRQKLRDQLPTEEAAQRVAGEDHHDDRRAQPLRHVVGGQRDRRRHDAADADAGDEAPRHQLGDRGREHAGQRGDAEEHEARDQHRLASQPVARRSGRQRAHHDADAAHYERVGEGGTRNMPGRGQRRHGHADRGDVVTIEHLRQGAEQGDSKLQRSQSLGFQP